MKIKPLEWKNRNDLLVAMGPFGEFQIEQGYDGISAGYIPNDGYEDWEGSYTVKEAKEHCQSILRKQVKKALRFVEGLV